MPTKPEQSFVHELAVYISGHDGGATLAWLHLRLAQDRPAELARCDAHWPQLEEHEQIAIVEVVLEGREDALEERDARIPHFIVSDYRALAARASHIAEA